MRNVFQIRTAPGLAGFIPIILNHWDRYGRQQSEDGNHDEEIRECECASAREGVGAGDDHIKGRKREWSSGVIPEGFWWSLLGISNRTTFADRPSGAWKWK